MAPLSLPPSAAVTRFALALALGLLAWTQVGYGAFLALFVRRREEHPPVAPGAEPSVSLIVAAHREEAVIAEKVANALALDWPRDRLEVIVAVDGDGDATAQRAREAGADLVLECPRGGKHAAQAAAVERASGELLAFSDANAIWDPDALRALAGPLVADEEVAYACGRASFQAPDGTNQEGLYWRYELFLRARESALHSITAGNGAIYALRRADWPTVDTSRGHDLALPFQVVKRGRRAVYVPAARASERMVASIEGEWRRKRRMMRQAWPIVAGSGLLDPRGYPPRYAFAIASHRALRYGSPLLHAVALLTAVAGRRRLALAAQLALLGAAAVGGRVRARPLLIARYYVLTTAAIGFGLWDWLRQGATATWDAAEGTR